MMIFHFEECKHVELDVSFFVVDEIAVDAYNKLDDSFISTVEPGEHRISVRTYPLEERKI